MPFSFSVEKTLFVGYQFILNCDFAKINKNKNKNENKKHNEKTKLKSKQQKTRDYWNIILGISIANKGMFFNLKIHLLI